MNNQIVPAEGTNQELPDVRCDGEAATVAFEAFVTQGILQPGEQGWWKVWGAAVRDIEAGDLVMVKDRSADVIEVLLITGTFEAKAAPVRVGFISNGERITLGLGCPIVLLRGGTRNTLARSVR